MKNNPIARNNKFVLAQGEDVADGMTAIQDDVGLKQTRDSDLRPILAQLKGDHGPLIPVGTPAYLGLIYLYVMTARRRRARPMRRARARTRR